MNLLICITMLDLNSDSYSKYPEPIFRNTEKVIICDLHKINATIQVALNVKNIPVSDDFMYGLE